MKRTIKESQLRRIISETVKNVINEYGDTPKGQYMLGKLQARKGDSTWAPSFQASVERDQAAEKAEQQGRSYNITHKNMLNAYRRGKNGETFESKIRRIVRNTINEGHWNPDIYDKWEQVREMVGDDTMLNELYNFLSSDQIEGFINDHMDRNYELGLNQDYDDMDESKTRRTVNENVEYDDHMAISDELNKLGWAYSDSQDVTHKQTGRKGIRWRIEPYRSNLNGTQPADIETVKQTMTQLLGNNNVQFSNGQNKYAPEQTVTSMITLEPEM